jgi:uncharacterized protein
MRHKHIPQRTCVGCRQVQGKREMVRVVRTPEGHVEVDETGKRPGRGAYVHRTRECWELALQKDHLGLALRAAVSSQDRAALEGFAKALKDN